MPRKDLKLEATMTNETIVLYCGQKAPVRCDRRCDKAWGINGRPREQLSDNPDDYAFLADGELGTAPLDPSTCEGGEAKPLSPNDFPTKWCVRECERCAMSEPDEWMLPLQLPDFSKRRYNIPSEFRPSKTKEL